MSSLKSRLNMHFTACAAVAATAVAAAPQQAEATIQWSGAININIPTTTAGVYVNIQTGAFGTAAATPGWDINPWSSSGLGFFNPTAPAGGVYVVSGTGAANLTPGTLISGASTFCSGSSTVFSQWNLNSSNNLLGFRFNDGGGNLRFGWARISLSGTITAQPRAIVEYAYEDSGAGIQAGAIPAPGAVALLGAAGLMGSRRRRSA